MVKICSKNRSEEGDCRMKRSKKLKLCKVLFLSILFCGMASYSFRVYAMSNDKENRIEISDKQKEKMRSLVTDFFEAYYDGLVNQKIPALDRYVVSNNNTNLYLSMLKSDVQRSIILGTGYKDYKMNIAECSIESLSQNCYKVKFLYDLEYHYKMSEDIASAEYNKNFEIELKLISDNELRLSKFNSDSKEYDNFKEEITETCIAENGRLSTKNYMNSLDIVSEKVKYETKEIKNQLGIHAGKKLSQNYAYADREEEENEKDHAWDKAGDLFFNTLAYFDNSKKASAASKRTYSPANAVKYARKYANVGKNKKGKLLFYYVNGNDCTNFVSQCVWAGYGGYVSDDISKTKKRIANKTYMTGSWYGGTGGGYANWENVSKFASYVSASKTYGPRGKIYNNNGKCTKLSGIKLGDVIQMKSANASRYGHSLFVTQVNYTPGAGSTYFVSCHSYDALNKNLADVYSEWGRNSYARRISFSDAKFK